MATSARTRSLQLVVDTLPLDPSVPAEVIQAQAIEWDATVDAYLFQAAQVGRRYAALVYSDRSGVNKNGMTIATPPLEFVEAREGFKLMRSLSGQDYFVITSELKG